MMTSLLWLIQLEIFIKQKQGRVSRFSLPLVIQTSWTHFYICQNKGYQTCEVRLNELTIY